MGDTVGLMVGRRLLADTLAGKQTFEDVEFYMQAARRYGVELFLFEPGGVAQHRRTVTGYVPTSRGELRRVVRKLPAVVYDRTSPKKKAPGAWLERQGVRVFNPPVRFDKYDAYQLLRRSWTARGYLPETHLLSDASLEWFARTLKRGAEVFVKPRSGSLGRRVARFVPLKEGRCRYQWGERSVTFASARSAWKMLIRQKGSKADRYIVQQGIPLAEVSGKRFDLRVPVQRNSEGDWEVAAPRARLAGRLEYVTNVARGGSVEPNVRALYARSLPDHHPDSIARTIESAALDIASAIARKHPLMADLGLDMGVDKDGRPWLIEANIRPLRYTVEGVGDWAEAYHAPIGYASYLLREDAAGESLFASLFFRKTGPRYRSSRNWL